MENRPSAQNLNLLLQNLLPSTLSTVITEWLKEDLPSFDYGGYVVGNTQKVAILFAKANGVLAGVPFVNEIFHQLGCTVKWNYSEGDFLSVETDTAAKNKSRIEVAQVTGPANKLLLGERVALNLLARCSGIATRARKLKNMGDEAGFKGVIAGTRKTTPGFRIVEKYGMSVGGIDNHRMDLSSMVMLKDNHIWAVGSIPSAVKAARSVCGFSMKIEVECQSEEEAVLAAKSGADVVMLDNFSPNDLKIAASSLRSRMNPSNSSDTFIPKVLIEASGGISEATINQYFCEHIDIISMGDITQGVPYIDFSLKIQQV
ncbi:hypothetical protein BB560_001556 [Smittium megazygosporum]|uniref:Nicotinate-nucleotide pyrophosphorylase [carboxylating] n=1 Tax=Smittium megazygosporum TaxID=133381 RepID=A0A2T9ZH80_9FUNG|nr:hypothetical protein BB560_001556 [Smittium megazygosporum]